MHVTAHDVEDVLAHDQVGWEDAAYQRPFAVLMRACNRPVFSRFVQKAYQVSEIEDTPRLIIRRVGFWYSHGNAGMQAAFDHGLERIGVVGQMIHADFGMQPRCRTALYPARIGAFFGPR